MSEQAAQGALSLTGVTKRYGSICACDEICLDVRGGEFVTLLGPSGSGKTTTLRIVAGFTEADRGDVVLDGADLTALPPYRRDIGMVFQNYALFPHMRALDNVAFPLRMRGVKSAERRRQAAEALELVQLGDLGDRFPSQLSGGQQQRVALARAIVFKPKLLLMDEPLGALDKKLREAMQLEITRLSRRLGVTVVYVTHDQEEALAMSDRIAIYNNGRIEQLGTGEDLYERPASQFVAGFIGESNLLPGRFERDGEDGAIVTERARIRVSPDSVRACGLSSGDAAAVVLRPEHARIQTGEREPAEGANVFRGTVTEVIYLGSTRKCIVALDGGVTVQARVSTHEWQHVAVGSPVSVEWDAERSTLVRASLEPDRANPEETGAPAGAGAAADEADAVLDR